MQPRLIVRQKITAFVNKYEILQVVPGQEPQLVAQAQQKRLAFREKVMFYTDAKRDKVAFTFRAEKIMDVHGRYFVEDAKGSVIGMFKKEFGASLVNSTWKVLDASGMERMVVKESNQLLAIMRRIIGWLPFVGELGELLVMLFRYHFEFIDVQTSRVVGQYRKTTLIKDHYELAMDDAIWQQNDWRVLAAMSVALDALQSR